MITTLQDRWAGIYTSYDLIQWYNDVRDWCDEMNLDYQETVRFLRGF